MRGIATIVAALIGLATLAGCTSSPAARDIATAPTRMVPTQDHVLAGGSAIEPSLAVSPDGKTIYVAAPDYSANANHVWRSGDTGATWKDLGLVADFYGTNDADVLVRADGTLVVATQYGGRFAVAAYTYSDCIALATSADQGASWQIDPAACGSPGRAVYDRPWLAETGGKLVDLVLEQPHPVCTIVGCASPLPGRFQTALMSEAAGGALWTETALDLGKPFIDGPLFARGDTLAFAGIWWSNPDGKHVERSGPFLARSTDHGATWTPEAVANDTVANNNARYAEDNGTAYVAWLGARGDGSTVARLATRPTGGEAAGWVTRDLDLNGTDRLPTVAAAGGHVLLAWIRSSDEGRPAELNATTWRLVGTYDGAPFDLGVVQTGRACLSFESCDLKQRALGDFFSTAILPDGRGVLAFSVAQPGDDMTKAKPHVAIVG